MFPCESIFPQDEYVPRREKVHKTGIYSQMRIYSPNWEIFPQWGKFPPGRNIFLFGENEGNIFPFGEKEGNIFPFGVPTGNIFPPFTPDPPRLGKTIAGFVQVCRVLETFPWMLKMFPCESISHRMNIFPKEKTFTEQEYIPKWGYIPQTEKFSLNGENFLPERGYFPLWEEGGEYFLLWGEGGEHFPLWDNNGEYFPSVYPGPSASWENYCWIRSSLSPFGNFPVNVKNVTMWVFSHRMNIFPKEKKFTKQEYIPK